MLLTLAVAAFAIGTSEFVPVGPIREIVRDLSDASLIGGESTAITVAEHFSRRALATGLTGLCPRQQSRRRKAQSCPRSRRRGSD